MTRRTRILGTPIALAAVSVLLAACSDNEDDATEQPNDDPSSSSASAEETPASAEETSAPAEEVVLPDGVLPLPEPDAGESFATLDAGRYQVPLSDTLAFEIDLPQDSYAHSDGLYVASREIVLKVELAGEQYGVPRDPCTDQTIEPAGPTVEDLVRAIRDEPLYRVSRPTPVELGGAEGLRFEMRFPPTYDTTSCQESRIGLPGNRATRDNMPASYLGHWHVLDVDGQRVVVRQICEDCEPGAERRMASTVRTITFTQAS